MRKFLVLSAVALLLSTGCVSAAKYDLVQKDLDERTKERDSLTEKSDMLSKQMMAQAVEIDNLKKENQDLQNKVNELSPKAERAEQLEKATQTYQDLAKKLEKEIQEGQIEITEMKNRLTVTMVDKIIFPSGSANISKEGKKVLDKVIDILKDVKDKRIQVEGHTDNVPIVSSLKKRFPTNWELSTGRATEVVRYLQEAGGLDAKLLSATGYSEYQPVASNESETGKRKNRRIEIVLLPLLK
jgi:chemotaxis protein MotB